MDWGEALVGRYWIGKTGRGLSRPGMGEYGLGAGLNDSAGSYRLGQVLSRFV
jgi:hypothetical protein